MPGSNHHHEDDEPQGEAAKKRDARQELREALQATRAQIDAGNMGFEQQVEWYILEAKYLKARFDAMVEAGFVPQQAWDFIRSRGLN